MGAEGIGDAIVDIIGGGFNLLSWIIGIVGAALIAVGVLCIISGGVLQLVGGIIGIVIGIAAIVVAIIVKQTLTS